VVLAVGPRHRADAGDDPVVVVFYGSGIQSDPESFLALDAGNGQIVLPGRQYPLPSTRGGGAIKFADGVLVFTCVGLAGGDDSLSYSYNLRVSQ